MSKGRMFWVALLVIALASCVDGITAVGGCPGFAVADSLRGGSMASDSTFTISTKCVNGLE